jgi:hypothetical protein
LDRQEPVPPVVDAETYLTLVTVANELGELVARANAEQRYPAEQQASAIYEQVRARWSRSGPRSRPLRHARGGAGDRDHPHGADFGHAAEYLFGPASAATTSTDPVQGAGHQVCPAVAPTQRLPAGGDQAVQTAGQHHAPEQGGGDQGHHGQRGVPDAGAPKAIRRRFAPSCPDSCLRIFCRVRSEAHRFADSWARSSRNPRAEGCSSGVRDRVRVSRYLGPEGVTMTCRV